MSLCAKGETVVDLAEKAARRAFENYRHQEPPPSIALFAIGTESSLDESRPLSAFVAQRLNLSGFIRSYEVKHACYGGTLAIKQACEWLASGAAKPNDMALVIAVDECLYAYGHPAEATQGAGAVAMLIGRCPEIASISTQSYVYSEPSFDFWRPFGEKYPYVHAKHSIELYNKALLFCIKNWIQDHGKEAFETIDAFCCHTPFPRMVVKSLSNICEKLGYDSSFTKEWINSKVIPHLGWNKRIGNSYTASLWFSVAHALGHLGEKKKIAAFSYGSGCGSELLFLESMNTHTIPWTTQIDSDFDAQISLTAQEYSHWRHIRDSHCL
jgi:hydroxymethylglutaryl-CoA synthase